MAEQSTLLSVSGPDAARGEDDGGIGRCLATTRQLQGKKRVDCHPATIGRFWTCLLELDRPPSQFWGLIQGGSYECSILADIYYKYRARVSLLERCPQRVTQCKEAISRMVPPQKLEAVFQQEVSAVRLELGHDHDRWTFVTQVEKIFLEARTVSLLPPSPFTL